MNNIPEKRAGIAFLLAILCWSVSIVLTKKLAIWIGWLGIILFLAAAAFFISGMAVNNLQGFRLFVTSIVVWLLVIGVALCRQNNHSPIARRD